MDGGELVVIHGSEIDALNFGSQRLSAWYHQGAGRRRRDRRSGWCGEAHSDRCTLANESRAREAGGVGFQVFQARAGVVNDDSLVAFQEAVETVFRAPRRRRRLPARRTCLRPGQAGCLGRSARRRSRRWRFRRSRARLRESGSRRAVWARAGRWRRCGHFPRTGCAASPCSKARTTGWQPSACTAIIFGRLVPIQPSASISSNAFHMPMMPTPPPVG